MNDDTQSYHETITRCFIHAVRLHLAAAGEGGLVARANALLTSPYGRRDWPLNFYSRERLFSVAARREFVELDLAPLPTL